MNLIGDSAMKFFDLLITDPVMWLVKLSYKIIPNHILAIILFTLFIKIIFFPFSLWAQVQAVKLAKVKPKLDDIKAYYSHDLRLLLREQRKLYKQEKYSSFAAILPLLLQIPIIIAVIRGLDATGILAETPSNLLLPLLSAFTAFALCYVQNLCNVLAKEMRFFAKWGMAIFLTCFSLYFTIVSGVGFGVYWTAGNLLAIVVQLVCNAIFNPKKHVTYEILPPPKKDKQLLKRQHRKQKIDVPKFNKTKKNLVFYSEASGFYKYFKGMVEYLLANSKIKIHYLTSDINDQVFKIQHERFFAYYCGPTKLITTLMKLDCKVMVMTMQDLHKHQYKRSIVNKEIEYVYTDHGFGSFTFSSRKHAFDHYDTIFCIAKQNNQEIRTMEAYYGTKEKKLVNTGYDLFDKLKKNFTPKSSTNSQKTIIIAPSWQKDNIFESCIHDIMNELLQTDYKVILRPHPEFTKRFPRKIESLKSKYKNAFQLDFATEILDADIIITDWSTIGSEFAYATNKPVLFINTPMKIMNTDWDKYGITPIDISLREKIGVSVNLDEIGNIREKLMLLKEIKNPCTIIQELMYDNSAASETSGKYLIEAVKNGIERQKQK